MRYLPGSWEEKILYFDLAVKQMADNLRHPAVVDFFQVITYLGSPYAFIVISILITLIFWKRKLLKDALWLNITLLAASKLNHYFKNFFARQRPSGEMFTYAAGFSFPSGHAMISAAFYGFLAYLSWKYLPENVGKTAAIFLVVLIFLIGLSRVYLNVHYMSDVIAGFICGGLLLAGGIAIKEIWQNKF